jgi:hypothetical protein
MGTIIYVRDYAYQKQHTLNHYHANVRYKADDIVVYNYPTTRFTAVDSYPDIWYHRFVTKPKTDDLALNQYHRLRYYTTYAHNNITHLANASQENVVDGLYRTPQQMRDYQANDKPFVERYKGRAHVVDALTVGNRPNFMIDFTDNLRDAVRDYVYTQRPKLSSIAALQPVLDELGTAHNREMLREMREKTYPQMKMILEQKPILDYIADKRRTARLNYLLETRYQDLFDFLEDPDKFIYKAMLNTFDEYFTYQFLRWSAGHSS